jgi:glyoxylase-like metal-dependent hydrolase (beta-lactamase superfamily II)
MADEFALDLYNTYRSKLLTLPADTDILPAHFSRTVKIEFGKPFHSPLQELRKRIPFLQASKDQFISYVLQHIPPTPPNYETILRINRGEAPHDSVDFEELEEGPNRCALTQTASN